MATELKIKISTTADVKAVQDAISSIDGIEKVSKTASKEIDNTSSSLDRMASSVKTLIASYVGYSAISSVIKSGVELTSQFEQMKIGIASLIAVNSQNVTSMGQHINASQKFALAQKDSAEAIQLLRKANLETPATLAQLTQGFQSALGPAMALGFSVKETVKYSTLMTQAAAAMGVPMDQLSQEMASILNGNIDMNSVVAKNIGLTNEQVKAHIKQGDIYDFLIGKLSDFGAAGKEMENSWSGITSELEDSWNNFKMSTVHDSGIFDAAKSGATELNKILLNQNGELDSLTKSLTRHTEELAAAFIAFKVGGTITSGLTAVSGSILAIKTAEEAALIGSIALEASMMRMAAFARANPIFVTVTFTAILTESFTAVRDWLEGDKINANGSKVLQAAIAKAKDESSLEGQARSIGANYNQLSEQLNNQLKQRSQLVKASVDTKHIDYAIAKTKQALKDSQSVSKDFYNLTNSVDGLVEKPKVKSDAQLKEEAAAAKKAADAAENLKQAYLSINKDIAGFTGNDHEKSIANINDQAEKYRKAKVDEVKIGELTSAAMTALYQKENEERNNLLIGHYQTIGDEDAAYYLKLSMELDAMVKKGTASYAEINTYREDSDRKYLEKKAQAEFQADEQAKEAIKTYNAGLLTAQIDTFTAIGDTSSAYYLQEEQKMKRLAETRWYTNAQMLAIKAKDNDKFQKEQWAKDNKFWVGLFENMNKAMEDQFFNAMTGKFNSFGSWLKDFWSSITQSMARGLSKSIADSILGTGNNSGGGIQNIIKGFGIFDSSTGGSASYGVGSILTSSQMSFLGGNTNASGLKETTGGTVYDVNGNVKTAGNDLYSIANQASTLNSAYNYLGSAYNSISGMLSGASTASAGHLTSFAASDGFNTALASSGSTAGSAAGISAGTISAGASLFFHTLSGYLWGSGGPLDQGYASQYHDNLKYGAGSLNWSQLGTANGSTSGYGWMTDASAWKNNLNYMADPRNMSKNGAGGYFAYNLAMLNPIAGITGHVDPITAGLLGGLFGKKSSSVTGQFADIYGSASADSANGAYVTTGQTTTKSWFKKSTDYWVQIQGFTSETSKGISQYIGALDGLLSQLGSAEKITVKGGRFTSLQSFLDNNVVQSFFSKITTADVGVVTEAWKTYASSISKSVLEGISAGIWEMTSFKRSFTEWSLGSGTVDQLKFTADYLQKDLLSLEKSMGATDVTSANYLQKYDEAMKAAYTPETIKAWDSLGTALMSATDANTKYTESLKALSKTALPKDMMLSRTADATSITGQSNGTVTALMLDAFQKMLYEMQAQTTILQLNRGMA